MNIEIITIGDELLIGQVVDTNSGWIGAELNKAGFRISQRCAIGDSEQAIIDTLNEVRKRADVILITGGLGPTKDDLTKIVLCKYFDSKLVFSDEAYKDVEAIFRARGREVNEINKQQAYVPDKCKIVPNKTGTAPGMWFEDAGNIFVSMPGVPFEMKAMMTSYVIPQLQQRFATEHIVHKTIMTQGVGESFMCELIASWEDQLPAYMKLAYLPGPGMVRLRLTAISNQMDIEKQVADEIKKVMPLIEKYVYGYDDESIEVVVGRILTEQNKTVATAESCTGGYISHLLTSVPGSSAYYMGSVVAYANEVKTQMLGVDESTIEKYGAVSGETVTQMANGIRKLLHTDYAIATSGIAGPGGATADKPVGTVWIAVAGPDGTETKKFLLGTDRMRVVQVAGETALNMLRKKLVKQ